MTGPVPPPVPLPGGVVLGPDGSVSFPGQAQQDQAAAEGLAPVVPGLPEPAPRPGPPPTIGSGQFTVDLERAPQALRELRAAKINLQSLLHDASLLANVNPPGSDSVSRDAAQALSATAIGGPGSLRSALSAGIDHLSKLIEKVDQDLRRYGQTESQASGILQDRA